MPRNDAKVYSIMDGHRLNTLIKAEVQAWAIDLRVKHGGEYMLEIIKALPYDDRFGVTLAAIVADLKANWRLGNPDLSWGRRDEELAVQNAIRENKACQKRLGRGAFSSAFLMKDGRVLKINCNKTEYDSWLQWAKECQNSEYNPFLPRIYSVDAFSTTYVAFMEVLTPWDDKVLPLHAFDKMAQMIHEYPTDSWSKIKNYPVYEPHATKDHYVKVSEAIGRVIQSVVGSRVDLHTDNAMFRGRQIVFIDPIAWGKPPSDSILYTEAKKKKEPVVQSLGQFQHFASWFDVWRKKAPNANPAINRVFDMDINLMYPHVIKRISSKPVPRKLPEFKIKDNGKRFGLSLFNGKEAKNLRFLTPQPWFRQQEKVHNSFYNKLLEGLKFDDFFAKGEPQPRHQLKILKGRKEVNAQGAQAP